MGIKSSLELKYGPLRASITRLVRVFYIPNIDQRQSLSSLLIDQFYRLFFKGACQNACQACIHGARLVFTCVSPGAISLLLSVINRLHTSTYKSELQTVDPKVEKI